MTPIHQPKGLLTMMVIEESWHSPLAARGVFRQVGEL